MCVPEISLRSGLFTVIVLENQYASIRIFSYKSDEIHGKPGISMFSLPELKINPFQSVLCLQFPRV